MKLGIIGGGSVRTPLLIKNLLERKDPDLNCIALYDKDRRKQKLIKSVLDEIQIRIGNPCRIEVCTNFDEMVQNSDFIFSSFREGGDEGRILDETIPSRYGMLGQETVGAGGASMALRTIPVALDYADRIHKIAPEAWLINFTNPSGILSQAMLNYSSHSRIIGICDAPIVVKNMAARYLNTKVEEIDFKSFGLNHLGWVHDISLKGKPLLEKLVAEAEAFAETEPLYKSLVGHIKEVGLIPNEYLLFYLYSEEIRKKYEAQSYKRSQFIADINRKMYQDMEKKSDSFIDIYQNYLQQREGSYMAVETGNPMNEKSIDLFAMKNKFGYDDVAIAVMDALRGKQDIILPINRKNDSCSYLLESDVVEVDTMIRKDGFDSGFTVPELPGVCRELIQNVKFYERNLVKGYMERDRKLIVEALKANPLIKEEHAEYLLIDIIKSHNLKEI